MTTTIDRRPVRSGQPKSPAGGTGRRPRMDPRLRQRRTEVLRAQGRRRLRVLVLLVSLPLVALVVILGLRSSWLSVRHIGVTGNRQTPTGAVERAVDTALRHPMISVNLGALETRLDALPWVGQATVTRSWPSSLQVEVQERTPVASVQRGSSWARLDASGRVLAVVGSAPPGQPRLAGSVPSGLEPGAEVGPQMRGELAVAAAVPSSLRAGVDGIGPEPDGGVQLTLAQPSGARVEIGPTVQLGSKMAALQTVLAQVDLSGVTVIDVRVPGQPALTRS